MAGSNDRNIQTEKGVSRAYDLCTFSTGNGLQAPLQPIAMGGGLEISKSMFRTTTVSRELCPFVNRLLPRKRVSRKV